MDECGNGAARCCLGGNMADAGSTGAAGETPVGDESYLLAKAHTHDIGGWRKHLLHAPASTRPLPANDPAIPRAHPAVHKNPRSPLPSLFDAPSPPRAA